MVTQEGPQNDPKVSPGCNLGHLEAPQGGPRVHVRSVPTMSLKCGYSDPRMHPQSEPRAPHGDPRVDFQMDPRVSFSAARAHPGYTSTRVTPNPRVTPRAPGYLSNDNHNTKG